MAVKSTEKDVLDDKEKEKSESENNQDDQTTKVSLEVTTAKAVVTLFIALERLFKARNLELAMQLSLQRNEVEAAINDVVQQEG